MRCPAGDFYAIVREGRFRESEVLRHLFETTVACCIEEGLVSGQRMAIDVSLIEADANKQNSTPKEEWDPAQVGPAVAPRAVRAYLDTLDGELANAFGAASEVQPNFTSHSDPASQWTATRIGEPVERHRYERQWRTRSSGIRYLLNRHGPRCDR